MNPKHKICEIVLPECKTNDNFEACFKNKRFITSSGFVTCKSLKMANIS
jgi:hypothetical protein